MKRDWFAPVILVPAAIMAAACMIWVLLAGSGVGDTRGGLCGRALHWYSSSATVNGGEWTASELAAENSQCHNAAVQRINAGNYIVGGALAASILAVVLIRRRERRSTELAREEAAPQGEGVVGRWLTDDGSA